MIQKIHQKKRKISLINTQTIQNQIDFHDLKNIIRDKTQEKKHKKTKIKCNFSKSIKKILQCKQFKYKMILCISSEKKKIIHQKYITSNDRYVFSEFYIQAKQLQEKL